MFRSTQTIVALALACITAHGGAPAVRHTGADRAPPSVAPQRAPASARDSTYALRTAKNALRTHHFQFRTFMNNGPEAIPAPFVCEKNVQPYCFGPENGRIPLGATLFAIPVEFRTWETHVPKMLRKRVDYLVRNLIDALDAALKKIPGDRWVIGQKVFHLVQHGEIERANETARGCRSDGWWCAALVGYSSYLLNRHADADSAFSVALESLPPGDRCGWDSAEDLLNDDPDRKWYAELDCAQRREANRTLWWLADPLYLTPGNERRSAHYYREVFRRLFSDSNESLPQPGGVIPGGPISRRTPLAFAPPRVAGVFERDLWKYETLQSLIRSLGVPAFAMVEADVDPDAAISLEPQILLQYVQPTYRFIPTLAAVQDPRSATVDSWDPHDVAASERYRPSFGIFRALDFQLAYFRRGDSARIVAAIDVAQDTILIRHRGRALVASALVLTTGPDDVRIFRDSSGLANARFSVHAPPESAIVSIESMVSGTGAARARLAAGPPSMPSQRASVSDILLVGPGSATPDDLDDAAARALPSTTITGDSTALLFWEVYGLAAGDSISYTLAAIEGRRSALTGIGRLIGVVGGPREAAITWSELSHTAAEIAPRSVMLDISQLGRGSHTLRLEVKVSGQEPVQVLREITIAGT